MPRRPNRNGGGRSGLVHPAEFVSLGLGLPCTVAYPEKPAFCSSGVVSNVAGILNSPSSK